MPIKRRRRPVATDRRFRKKAHLGDYGPTERWQHSGRTLEHTDQPGILAARATEEHLVDVLVLRGVLSKSQSEAAFKLKLDFQRAGLAAHVIGGYNPVRTATDYFYGNHDRNDFEESAYQRWRNAVRELGLLYSEAVVATVCLDEQLKSNDVPRLQLGLEKLVDWYRLPKGDG